MMGPAPHVDVPMGRVRPGRAAPKILLYSHDSFGLGNIRRTLLLAECLSQGFPGAATLIVTGSPVIHALRLPDGIDYIKLPCLDRVEADRYEPRFLSEWSVEVKDMRREILRRAVMAFEPDLILVDKRPAGIDGELLPALEGLARCARRPRVVLGLRDILDEPERTRASLREGNTFETIERFYDEVWVYGCPEVFDAVREYDFPEPVARRTVYCGYLRRPTATVAPHGGPPHVLVTTGGGGDGADVVEAYLEGLLGLPRRLALRTTVVFGPEMAPGRREALLQRFARLPDVTFSEFEADLAAHYAEADVVVAMAGYNTVCELLSAGRPAVLVPRAEPVREQLVRARRLAALGCFDMIEPDDLRPARLMAAVLRALRRDDAPASSVDLGGLPRILARTRTLLGEQEA